MAAGNRDTAAAAVEVLRAGGAAVDAAVAAGFAAAVAEPGLSSLGGGGFLLDAPADGAPTLIDFFVDVPGRGRPATTAPPTMTPITVRFSGADQIFSAGWGSVAVPGCLAGYLQIQKQRGCLPLAEVVAPAHRLAREGVRLDAAQADVLVLLHDILTLTAEGRAIFKPGGELVAVGDRLRNPAFADFLEVLARDGAVDLAGIADDLDRAMRDGGAVTREDLVGYKVRERQPLTLHYRGGDIFSNPPPSFGASLVLEGLAGLAGQPRLDASPNAYERYARRLVAMADRHVVGPRSVRGTTHVSVVDGDGNVAAMTTSNGSCSGTFIPGTGIQLNNMLGETDLHPEGVEAGIPGERVGSMMMPTVVRGPDGAVVGVGSGGSERIPSALARVLTGVLDHRLPLDEVVHASRLHWDRSILQVEPGLSPEVLGHLRRSWRVNEWSRRDLYFGGAHAVARWADGSVEAVGDPRRGGTGVVVDL
ncbi:MAG TPA: gamma-glutamyltransferase [Frankiaceae bacterium]|nr:gamma-glutamyltransferase [Frankiaceae bacterium]